MSGWRRRIGTLAVRLRGILGLGVTGGIVSAVLGALFAFTLGMWNATFAGLPLDVVFMDTIMSGFAFFFVGGIVSSTFATLITATNRNVRSLEDLGLGHAGLLGGIAAAGLFIGVVSLDVGVMELVRAFPEAWPIIGGFGIVGASFSAALVGMARHASIRESAREANRARVRGIDVGRQIASTGDPS